jgi:hypothetical protein
MTSSPDTVYVSTGVQPALGEPQFLIEHDGTLYLTLAVLAYGADDGEFARLHDVLENGEPVKAVRYARAQMMKFANTDPPPDN